MRRHARRRLATRASASLRGLRPRFIVGFVLVAAASGSAAAGASYVTTREAVLNSAQDDVMLTTRARLNDAAGSVSFPPDRDSLRFLAEAAGDDTLVVYGQMRVSSGGELGASLAAPQALIDRVHSGDRLVWKRERRSFEGSSDVPLLIFGAPVLSSDGTRTGIEVYRAKSLQREEDTIAGLARSAALTLAISLVAAVLIALAAARGVLRPVRDLGHAARRLAAGELDVRMRPTGADELADLVMTFNQTASALERNVGELRAMEANARRFVADVSHELRTPLAAMTAVSDTLDEEAGVLGGDAGQAARLISAETRKLAALVEDLVEVSRFDAGRAVLRLSEVDLGAEISATIAARGWTDSVLVRPGPAVTAQVDRRRLDVIVANLVGNGLKHGGQPVSVEMLADSQAQAVVVAVRDNGPGMGPDVLPHVFSRFYKADSARVRSSGSGLGLAIAMENARLHGGTIEAANHPGGGAVFTVRLPLRLDVAAESP